MGSIIQTVQYQHILDHLFAAKQYWYAALPGLFDELAEGIVEAKKKNPKLDIELVIDPTETAFRSHYGSVDAIQKLTGSGISIKQIPNHRLGFIMSEDSGWMLFTQSRVIEKNPQGPNAICMNDMTRQELLYAFFEKDGDPEIIITSENIPSRYSTKYEVKPEALDEEAFDEVMVEIEQNPPPSPDFKRLLDVYSTKIKFIEFEVHGIKVHNRMVQIPNDILNLVDESLRDQIQTRLNVFDDETSSKLEETLAEIAKEGDRIRSELLKRVRSRKKSVLHTKHLAEFNRLVYDLTEKYKAVQQEIERDIFASMINLRKRLKEELVQLYKQKPPEKLVRFQGDAQFTMFVEDYASQKARTISLPTIESIMKGFKIEKRIFDPTYEDFSDQAFIEELEEIGFISKAERIEIVDEFEAIGTQKDEKG
ncbi:MAG: hypothetical protein JJ895_12505 [Balneolaceae bacterium]|nr:hypothetical protein [Balneolaceae bacterium]